MDSERFWEKQQSVPRTSDLSHHSLPTTGLGNGPKNDGFVTTFHFYGDINVTLITVDELSPSLRAPREVGRYLDN